MFQLIIDNKSFKAEILYVFEFISKILKIDIKLADLCYEDKSEIIINYSEKQILGNNIINIKPGNLFGINYLKKDSIPQKISYLDNIPIIYTYKDQDPKWNKVENVNSIVTNVDIIQSIFFMLTRYEEYVLWNEVDKDIYGRFAAVKSIAYKFNFLDIPIVNVYIDILKKWLKQLGYIFDKSNIDRIACLTHDVDAPFKYKYTLKNTIENLKKKGNTLKKINEVIKHTLALIDYNNDPFFTFDYIRSIEKKYNASSSFYFMSGGNSKFENFYDINDERIISLIRKLEYDECEVGYHYSFNSHNNLEMRTKEKEKLDKIFKLNVYGGRNHFLRFTPIESWRICENIGLLYDSTLSYADYNGFRCGTSYPYQPFDLEQHRKLNIYEIPLIVMEGTLKEEKYRNMNCDEAFNEIKKMIDVINRYGGVFSLLWHNSSFDKPNWNGWKKVFELTLDYLYQNNMKFMNGREVIESIINEV